MVKSKEKSVDFQWFWTASQFGQEKVQEGYIIPGLSLRVIPQNCGIVSRSLSGTMVLDTSSFVGHSNWQCQLKLNFITINSIGSLRVFSIERKRKWKSIEKPFRNNGFRYTLLRRTLKLTYICVCEIILRLYSWVLGQHFLHRCHIRFRGSLTSTSNGETSR